MPSRSQGKAYPFTGSSVPALKLHTPVLNCVNTVAHRRGAPAASHGRQDCQRPAAVWDQCPLCGQPPLEPVRCDGQVVCRGCVATCEICSGACIPGDTVCTDCARHISPAGQAVLMS